MSDQKAELKVEISYCPHLDLYHQVTVDGVDYFFTGAKLEATVAALLKTAQSNDADFLAQLTALARQMPHRVISIGADGQCKVSELMAVDHTVTEPETSTSGS